MDTMFILKKLAGAALMPFPLAMTCIAIGSLAAFTVFWRNVGRILVLLGMILILLTSNSGIANYILARLEHDPAIETARETAPQKQQAHIIVVLGGGHIPDPQLATESRLSGPSLARVICAVKLYRSLGRAKLILSGGSLFDAHAEAETMAELARELGVPQADMLLDTASNDTADQALAMRSLVGKVPFYLVTSAAHMPRSLALFNNQQLFPIPVPTDYAGRTLEDHSPAWWLPTISAMAKHERTFHEIFGLWWLRLGRH